jgi:hypothetical protein
MVVRWYIFVVLRVTQTITKDDKMDLYNFYTDEEVKSRLGRIPAEFEIVAILITEDEESISAERDIYAEKMGTDHWYFVDNGKTSSERCYIPIEDLLNVTKTEFLM